MLQPGHLVPHFNVTNLEGETVTYTTIWQRRNLVLITLPASDPDGTFTNYAAHVAADVPAGGDTACVITRDAVTGIPSPGIAVADRWGEIVYIAGGARVAELPSARDLGDWVNYVQHKCPECEGEAK